MLEKEAMRVSSCLIPKQMRIATRIRSHLRRDVLALVLP